MNIYHKKLNSIEELKREQIRLNYEKRHTKASDLNPIKEFGNKKSARANQNILGTILELAKSDSPLSTAMAIGKPLLRLLSKRRNNKREAFARLHPDAPKKQGLIAGVVEEIVVAYAIGKAVQMSIRGIRLYLKARKAKKEREKFALAEKHRGW